MCFSVTLTETWRRVFGLTTTVSNLVILFLCLALLVAGIAIRIKLDNRLELLEDYNPGALPIYLMITSGLLFLAHLLACKFCYAATYVESRSSKHHFFVAVIAVIVIMTVYLFICLIVTLAHSAKIAGAVREGMDNSINLYKSDMLRKQRVDAVQVEFECCGVDSFHDWLSIPWVNMAFVNVHSPDVKPYIKDGEYIKDDVPFSCCSRYSKRACVHHSIETGKAHRNYIVGDTLYPEGCVAVMTSHFHSSLITPTVILILVILIIQILTITLMRLLQTSIENADEMNDPEGEGVAYCLRSLGKGGDIRDYLKRKKSNVDKRDIENGSSDDIDDDIDIGDDDDDDDDQDVDDTKGLGRFNRPRKDDMRRGRDNYAFHDATNDDEDRTPWGMGKADRDKKKQEDASQRGRRGSTLKRPFDKGNQYTDGSDKKKMQVLDDGKETKHEVYKKTGEVEKGKKSHTDEKKGKKNWEDSTKKGMKKENDFKKDTTFSTDGKKGKGKIEDSQKDDKAAKKKEDKDKKKNEKKLDKDKKKAEKKLEKDKKKAEKKFKKDKKKAEKKLEKDKKKAEKKKDKGKKKDKKVKPPKKAKPKKPKKMKSPKKKKFPKGKKKK